MKITDEKKVSYLFAGSLIFMLLLGMVLEILEHPFYWMSIVTARYVPLTLVLLGCWVTYKVRFKVHFMEFIPKVRLLAVFLPMAVLTVATYAYHSLLYPVCAVFALATIIYIFQDHSLEVALFNIVLWSMIFAVAAMLKSGTHFRALMILVPSAVLILMSRKLCWFFQDSGFFAVKQIVALCILVLGVLLLEKSPLMQNAYIRAYFTVRGFGSYDSFYETALFHLGAAGVPVVTLLYTVFLACGWKLVKINKGFMCYYSVAAMSILTYLVVCDILKTGGIDVDLFPLGIGVGDPLEIGIWIALACVILPPDHLLPNGREYVYIPMKDDDAKKNKNEECSRFQELYEKLTRTGAELETDNETALWEELWFDKTDDIPDDRWDELEKHFNEFVKRKNVFCRDS